MEIFNFISLGGLKQFYSRFYSRILNGKYHYQHLKGLVKYEIPIFGEPFSYSKDENRKLRVLVILTYENEGLED